MHLPVNSEPELQQNRLGRWWRARAWSLSGGWTDIRAYRWLHHGVEGLLVALIILMMVSFWRPSGSAPVSIAVLPSPAASVAPADWDNTITAAHLFGQAVTHTSVPVAATASITVDGIVYSTRADDSEVVLTLNAKTDVYKVGASLPDGESVVAINPGDVQLVANGTSRRLAISKYGSADSEGPAAYAAMLHGTGLSTPPTNSASEALLGGNPETETVSFPSAPSPLPISNFAATLRAPPIRIPATATPLEQLQALRQQLIH